MRLALIDGLRGVAASAVVLHHLMARTGADWVMAYGYLGVAIFFVLSGFVIAMVIGDHKISPGYIGRFAARRAIRLDPPYWTSIATAILLAYLATLIGVPKQFPEGGDILAHLVYLQNILGRDPISVVYWTLCLEVQFYLFLLLLLWLSRRRVGSVAFHCLLATLLVLSLLEQAHFIDPSPAGLFLPYWFAFSLGATAYWVTAGRVHAGYLLMACVIALCAVPLKHGAWPLVAVATTTLLYVAARFDRMSVWLSGPLPQFLGRISYSLYLFHPLVGWSAQSVAMKFVGQWSALAVGLAVSIASAYIAYHILERPSIRWSHLVRTGRGPVAEKTPAYPVHSGIMDYERQARVVHRRG